MSKPLRTAFVVLLATLVGRPSEAHPQDQPLPPSAIAVGTKVRIVAPAAVDGRVSGLVLGMDDKSLLIATDDARLSVPRSAITQIEVSTGKRRRALRGMLIGAGVGVVALAVTAGTACTSDCDEGWGEVVLLGAGMGALYGAGIGALIKTDRWATAPLASVRVALAPVRGRGAQLQVVLRF